MGAGARLRYAVARTRLAIDSRLPDRPVTRTVRGVPMVLPRRHWLPHLAGDATLYARNLVDLARELASDGELVVLDIGANVGDSALLILGEVPARIVCVEGDAQWLSYLDRNVGHLDNVEIEPALLLTPDDDASFQIVHEEAGSSRMVQGDDSSGLTFVSTESLVDRHPMLAGARLVKTDTDGFDVKLAPAVARALSGSKPVVFMEYDPRPTRLLTPDLEPAGVWAKLAELGYEDAVVWTNGGDLLGAATLDELTERSAMLEAEGVTLPYAFWDVAVAHRDDASGRRALARLANAPSLPWP